MSEYLTVKQLAAKHPAFSEASLRYHIFYAEQNKLKDSIIRVGRKILISEPSFLQWLKSQSGSRNEIIKS
jgi:hypothetical protein